MYHIQIHSSSLRFVTDGPPRRWCFLNKKRPTRSPAGARPGIPRACAMHASTPIQKRMPNTAAARGTVEAPRHNTSPGCKR